MKLKKYALIINKVAMFYLIIELELGKIKLKHVFYMVNGLLNSKISFLFTYDDR